MPRHTDKGYERELTRLREQVLLMGSKVESMVEAAMSAYDRSSAELAQRTIEQDREVDRLELDIDERCLKLLARRQPVASDLRFITTALKLVTDLERMGDLAANICERVVELQQNPPIELDVGVRQMARHARDMLRDALDSFVHRDATKARQVVERDNLVDEAYAKTFPEVSRHMMSEPDNVRQAQRVLSVARYVERIADHATNIAEMVVFMVEGEDVRHSYPWASGAPANSSPTNGDD